MGAGEDDDPMAFVKHTFEGEFWHLPNRLTHEADERVGTWKPESERHIGEEKQQ